MKLTIREKMTGPARKYDDVCGNKAQGTIQKARQQKLVMTGIYKPLFPSTVDCATKNTCICPGLPDCGIPESLKNYPFGALPT